MKKILTLTIVSLILLFSLCSCDIFGNTPEVPDDHEHSFGEWETKTPATCTEAEVEVRKCECGEEETRKGDAPIGHNYVNEVAEEKYLATNECGKQPTYYKSCSCGEKGSETFAYGEVNGHVYASVVTAPTCTEAGYTTYTCSCGDSYVGDETKAIGHNMVTVSDDTHHWTECDREGCNETTEKLSHLAASISATSKLDAPMEKTTVNASDLTVTATCQCGHSFALTEGIELENATLVLGENTVTVKYGELSTTVSIMAEKFSLILGGSVSDDTYVSSANSSSKDKDNSSATELKAYSNSFRVYFRVNLKDAINSEFFNSNNAKVQLILTMINEGTNTGDHFDVDGSVMNSIYNLKAYNNTDKAFKDITWNGVNDTELHWHQGSTLVYSVANVGGNVTVADGKIIFTVAYSQIDEFVDEDGNLLLAFASPNTKSLSINSLEAADEALRPTIKVIINDDHLHVFGEWETKTPATCTEKEVQVRKCACGAEETREGATLDHDMKIKYDESYHWTECDRDGCDEATEKVAHSGGTATETEKAVCDTCGQSYGALADHVHAFGEWTTLTPATCTKAEVEERKCACGTVETREGDAALKHDIVSDAAVPATCTSTGLTAGEHCTRCDYKISQEVAEKLPHTPGAAATCTSVQECTVCHTVLNPKLAHDYKATVTAPTCEAAGYTTYTCACGDSYVGDTLPATGHSYGDWTTKTPATCTKAEVEERKCACGAAETRVGDPALDHDMKTKYDEAYHWTECDREGCNEESEHIAHSGGIATETEKAVCTTCGQSYGGYADHVHAYGDWTTKTPATCTKAEVEERKCACGAAETRVGDPALNHDIVIDEAKAATCTETGLTKGEHCTRCDYKVEREVTEKLPHTPGAAATCTTNQECTVCHTELAPKLGHKIENDPAKAATCTETGLTEGEHCTRCDYKVEQEVTEKLPHTPGLAATCTTNQTCTACGTEIAPKLGHNMVAASDSTHHWTKCDRTGCFEVTERIAHTAVSISAVSNITAPVATMVVKATDLTVTGKCACGADFALTEGIVLKNATLKEGNNTVTVNYGNLSTTVSIEAGKLDLTIEGAVTDDTNVNSSKKGTDNSETEELKAISSSFRVYFRVNIADALKNELFNPDYAKVQLILTFVNEGTDNGSYVDANGNPVGKIYTLKAYSNSNVAFSDITWNSVNNKEGSVGAYSELNWNNGYGLVSNVDGVNVTVADGKLTITFAYSEIEDLVDKDGNIILSFASPNAKSISVGSLENEGKEPKVKVLLNEDHVHAFNQENVADKYLASANCTETAKYYKSCSCGEMCFVTFDHGEVIEHQFGDWQQTTAPSCTAEGVETRSCTNCGKTETQPIAKLDHSYNAAITAPTCTEQGYTTYTCGVCGDSYVADYVDANGHSYGDWQNDESYHWKSCSCGDVAYKANHSGGTATETEQATCETCGVKYGGLASHEHNHVASVTAPTCTEKGFTTYTCACGDEYVADYVDAINHDMQTKYDADGHWTECSRCDEATESVAHFGGTATETEKAVCEVCGQSYGELKTPEPTEVTVAGTIKDDTYVDSGNKDKDFSTSKNELNVRTKGTTYYRSYFRFNFSDVLKAEGFEADKANAKVTFTFAVTSGTIADDTTFTFYAFDVDEATDAVAFSAINWNSVASGATYEQLGFNNGHTTALVGKKTISEAGNITYADGLLTITVNYSDIEACMDANGNCIFGFTTTSADLKVGSMENKGKEPAVSVTYTK